MKTREEIEALKHNWFCDPCYDLEEIEGFEEYREELLTFRKEQEERWKAEKEAKFQAKAERLGIPGNIILAEYIEQLENSIMHLTERVEYLEEQQVKNR